MGFVIKDVKFLGCSLLCRMFYRDEHTDPQMHMNDGDLDGGGLVLWIGQSARSGVLTALVLVPALLGPITAGLVAHC